MHNRRTQNTTLKKQFVVDTCCIHTTDISSLFFTPIHAVIESRAYHKAVFPSLCSKRIGIQDPRHTHPCCMTSLHPVSYATSAARQRCSFPPVLNDSAGNTSGIEQASMAFDPMLLSFVILFAALSPPCSVPLSITKVLPPFFLLLVLDPYSGSKVKKQCSTKPY